MSFDFNTLQFDDKSDTEFGETEPVKELVELLGEYNTGIHTFYNMQTEMRQALISDSERLLRYTKEQLEGRNIRGHYIVEVTKVTRCPYDKVHIGYGTSGINLQVIIEYKYRVIQKGIAFAVKASVDHFEKFSTYGDDIPIYCETNPEIAGFMVVKNRTLGAKKLLQIAQNDYTRKGLTFPSVIYSFEMKARDKNVTIIAQPLLPTKPLAFRLIDDPKPSTLDYLNAKVDLIGGLPEKFQQMLALYTHTNISDFGLERHKEFFFDTIGASFSYITDSKTETVDIDWDTLMELVHSSYVSLFNLWNHYRNDPDFKKDKYLSEFSKAKMNF